MIMSEDNGEGIHKKHTFEVIETMAHCLLYIRDVHGLQRALDLCEQQKKFLLIEEKKRIPASKMH